MIVENPWNHSMTASQKGRLQSLSARSSVSILYAAITRGGYLAVDYSQPGSKIFPYVSVIYGRKGGIVKKQVGTEYDHENNLLLDPKTVIDR